MRRVYAFSGSRKKRACVDCGEPATWLGVYLTYQIGDLLCDDHTARRHRILGLRFERRVIPFTVRIAG